MAEGYNRERAISVAFSIREFSAEHGWYDVIRQRCGSNDTPCQYESIEDWTSTVRTGHRFHDPCGSTTIDNIRVDGGIYNFHFTDAQFSFDLRLNPDPPAGPPGSVCSGQPDIEEQPDEVDEGTEEVIEVTEKKAE